MVSISLERTLDPQSFEQVEYFQAILSCMKHNVRDGYREPLIVISLITPPDLTGAEEVVMSKVGSNNESHNSWSRRDLLAFGGSIVGGMATGGRAMAEMSAMNQTWPGRAFGDGLLSGKVAVVTGAARGIGRSIAVDMAANGADVVGLDICAKITPVQSYAIATREDLDETGKLVKQHGRQFMEIVGDVRDIAFLRSTADQVQQKFGHIDIVVANAATQRFKPLVEMEDWEWNDSRICSHVNKERWWTDYCSVFHARQTRVKKHVVLFGLEVGNHRADEISSARVRQRQNYGKRTDPRACRYASHA